MFKILVRTKNYLLEQKIKLLFYYLISIFISLISLLSPKITGDFIDILVSGSKEKLFIYIKIFLLINALSLFFSFVTNKLYIYIQAKSAYKLNKEAILHVWDISLLRSQVYDSVYLADRINNDSNQLIIYSLNIVVEIISIVMSALFSSIFMIGIDKKIFFVGILAMLAYTLIYLSLKNKIYTIKYELTESKSAFSSNIYKQLDNIRSLKLHTGFQDAEDALDKSFFNLFKKTIANFNFNFLFTSFDNIIGQAISVFMFIYGGIAVINKSMSIGEYTMLNSYLLILISLVQRLFSLAKSTEETKVSLDRIDEILSIEKESNSTLTIKSIDAISLNIDFDYLYNDKKFSYQLTFKKGQVYKILGENGSGKSTLLDNMVGLYIDDYSGNIYYNGINIKEIDMKDTRKNLIAYLDQNLDIDNINRTCKIGLKEAQTLIKSLYLDKLLEIDKGKIWLLTDLDKMSGGELRKTQILGEIIKNPDLVILDEPANNLDYLTIRNLKKIISTIKKDMIVILVDHNKYFDDIVDEYIYI